MNWNKYPFGVFNMKTCCNSCHPLMFGWLNNEKSASVPWSYQLKDIQVCYLSRTAARGAGHPVGSSPPAAGVWFPGSTAVWSVRLDWWKHSTLRYSLTFIWLYTKNSHNIICQAHSDPPCPHHNSSWRLLLRWNILFLSNNKDNNKRAPAWTLLPNSG